MDQELLEQIQLWPKIDLHVHLEGTVRAETLLALSRRAGHVLPSEDPAELAELLHCRDTESFWKVWDLYKPLWASPEIYALIAEAYLEDAAMENHAYVEYRVNILGPGRDPGAADEIIHSLHEVNRSCRSSLGILARTVVGLSRHHEETARETIDRAIAWYRQGLVAGIDLNGEESQYPPERFREIFAVVAEAQVPFTIHAGEWAGAANVRTAVDMGARRIGHGVRAIEDPSVVELLAEKQVTLECCPSSNVCTGAVESLKEHPLPRFVEAGVPCVLGSDDPPLFGTSMTQELLYAVTEMGMKAETLAAMSLQAARVAFLPVTTRERLEGELRAGFLGLGITPRQRP